MRCLVSLVLRMITEAQILSATIQPIAVDVIDMHTFGRVHQTAVDGKAALARSAGDRVPSVFSVERTPAAITDRRDITGINQRKHSPGERNTSYSVLADNRNSICSPAGQPSVRADAFAGHGFSPRRPNSRGWGAFERPSAGMKTENAVARGRAGLRIPSPRDSAGDLP